MKDYLSKGEWSPYKSRRRGKKKEIMAVQGSVTGTVVGIAGLNELYGKKKC